MTRRLAFALVAAALLSGCSSMSDADGLFGYSPGQTDAADGSPHPVSASLAGPAAVLPLPPAPPQSSNRSVHAPASDLASAPGVLASAPAPVLMAQEASPSGPAADAAVAVPAGAIVAEEGVEAEELRIAALPAPSVAVEPAPKPIASVTEDGERDSMIASALAPASTRQTLGELPVGSNGTLILPAARNLEVIDIAPIRESMREPGTPEG